MFTANELKEATTESLQYIEIHLSLRRRGLKMGLTVGDGSGSDTDLAAVYKFASALGNASTIAPSGNPREAHERHRRQIAEVLDEPMSIAKIVELTGLDTKEVERCLTAEKNSWFVAKLNGFWKRSKKAASHVGIWKRQGAPKKKAAAAAPKKKPSPKPKPKTTKPKPNTSNAAEGRRAVARGERPPMKEAMAIVMGKSKMGAADVVEGLKSRGWMPNAQDPQQYVSYMLSSNKDVFERIERGQYKVRDGVRFTKKPAAQQSKKKSDTERELEELGIKTGRHVSANPFGNNEDADLADLGIKTSNASNPFVASNPFADDLEGTILGRLKHDTYTRESYLLESLQRKGYKNLTMKSLREALKGLGALVQSASSNNHIGWRLAPRTVANGVAHQSAK